LKTDSKILIVDDIPKNIQMAMNILKNEGYKMFYAKSGEMTLKLVNEHDFDLILLDIMMPDMNGFEVCTKLKNEEKTKNIPIIFLSGKDSSQDVEQAYECGGIDYVVKPFVTIELITKANSYVRLKQLEDKFELLKDTQNV
jgi:putative two-component system response regulator